MRDRANRAVAAHDALRMAQAAAESHGMVQAGAQPAPRVPSAPPDSTGERSGAAVPAGPSPAGPPTTLSPRDGASAPATADSFAKNAEGHMRRAWTVDQARSPQTPPRGT
eukprot:14817172-Alexandrium_andersonii.AAC.1